MVIKVEIKTVSLIGLGALGVLFGHHLSKRIGGDFSVVADEERISRYRRDGVFCNGERCDFNYVRPDEKCPPSDLILIAVKYNGLNDAVDAIKNHVGSDTIILSLLNGISSEEIIGRAYGMEKVLPCVSQGMDAVKEGNALTYHNMGRLQFGGWIPNVISEQVMRVARFFEKTALPHEVVADMKKWQWSKFMLNAGCNQVTGVWLCDYRGLQEDGPARETMIAAMREVAVLAEKEGVILTQDDINYWLNVIGSLNPDAKTSMQQDVEAGRYSEVEMFGGTILELAKKHGIKVPVNKMLYEKIKEIENKYQRGL